MDLVLRRSDILKARPDNVRICAVRADRYGNVEESVSLALAEDAAQNAVAVRRDAANLSDERMKLPREERAKGTIEPRNVDFDDGVDLTLAV